jgi:uncharacterized membrane protein
MLRPKKERPDNLFFRKFVMYFSLIMTLIYVMLGVFLIFSDPEQLNLTIPDNIRIVLGGILILYGAIRFVRVYQQIRKVKNPRKNED